MARFPLGRLEVVSVGHDSRIIDSSGSDYFIGCVQEALPNRFGSGGMFAVRVASRIAGLRQPLIVGHYESLGFELVLYVFRESV